MSATRLGALCAGAVLLAGGTAVPATAVADTAPAEVSEADRTFLRAAHQGNLAEIAAGRDAQVNATTACVKRVGALLVRDHRKLDTDLSKTASALGVKLPTAPTAAQQRELAAARAKAGSSAYDTAWLNAQDKAHRQTLALIDKELKSGKDSRVKAAAKAARPVVAMHAETVRGGTCRDTTSPEDVNADDGRQVATAEGGHEEAGLAAVIVGLLLAGSGGAVWAVRRRRNGADAVAAAARRSRGGPVRR